MNALGCKGSESNGSNKLFILGVYHLAIQSEVHVPIDFNGKNFPWEHGKNRESQVQNYSICVLNAY